MKSIKEKAEENCIRYVNTGNVAYQEFVAGANYVLEEIEKLVKFNRWTGQDLYELIEQLKEK